MTCPRKVVQRLCEILARVYALVFRLKHSVKPVQQGVARLFAVPAGSITFEPRSTGRRANGGFAPNQRPRRQGGDGQSMNGNLILIPARGGSTRVKGKNIKLLGGKPLVGHVISAAIASGAGRVVVSTNTREIAVVARHFGAEVPFLRPDSLSGAKATSISALLHALKWFRDNENWSPELAAFCPPTNPFTSAATLGEMFASLARKTDFNSVVTITKPVLHPFSLVRRDDGGKLVIDAITIEGKNANNAERSQDMPEFWQRTAGCSITWTRFFGDIFGEDYAPAVSPYIHVFDCKNCFGHEIGAAEALDIDTLEDWERAEKEF